MPTLRNVSPDARLVAVGLTQRVWVEPDETFVIPDDALEFYEQQTTIWAVVPDVSVKSTPAPFVAPDTE